MCAPHHGIYDTETRRRRALFFARGWHHAWLSSKGDKRKAAISYRRYWAAVDRLADIPHFTLK